jgi:hypothetical protein
MTMIRRALLISCSRRPSRLILEGEDLFSHKSKDAVCKVVKYAVNVRKVALNLSVVERGVRASLRFLSARRDVILIVLQSAQAS